MSVSTNLISIVNEYADTEKYKSWKILFTNLRIESDEMNKDVELKEAKNPQNKTFNRYRDVLPYDCTRVPVNGIGQSDYINANYVQLDGNKHQRRYILTQGPLSCTVSHFWRMVWSEQSTCIVMLNKVIEKDAVKCEQYFPLSKNDDINHNYEDLSLSLSLIDTIDNGAYVRRVMLLVDKLTNEERRITQFHYVSWPDFGVPLSPVSFLEFLSDVRSSGGLDDRDRPCVIHCSAGIGRSGTFVLIDLALLRLAEEANRPEDPPRVDIRAMVLELRKCRMGLVQTAEQLRFAYLAIILGARSMKVRDELDDINFPDMNGVLTHPGRDSDTSSIHDSDSDDSSHGTDSDSNDIMSSNPALDQAAAAARSRRGIPLEETLSEDVIVNQQRNDSKLSNTNNNNNNNDSWGSPSTDPAILDDRRQIREQRCNRTRAKIEEIRSKMRTQDMERTRLVTRLGLTRVPLSLTGRTRNSFIVGVSVVVGLVSVVCGFAFYKYAN